MTPAFRKFTKRLFVVSNIITVLFFFLAALAAYVNPGQYWIIGVLGVGFIFFLTAVIAFLIVWLLVRSKWVWLSVAALVICWSQIYAVFGFHFLSKYEQEKQPGALRVLQWNVTSFDEVNKARKGGITYREEMMDYIAEQDADVLCFQEFFESSVPKYHDPNLAPIKNKLSYPYHYFVVDNAWWEGKLQFGVAIFSRYPIIDSSRKRFDTFTGRPGESLIKATLDVNGQRVNIYTVHLQSFLFRDKDYRNIEILKRPDDNKGKVVEAGKGILSKFRNAYKMRNVQADVVRNELDKSIYPAIITGDFNDVPNSYTYSTVRGDYQDAFVKKSSGLGRTFFFISPTLRIDYILADKRWEVVQYKRDLKPYSDHYPLVSDLILRESKPQ
ncbi:MAG: endonuclease/exonuclease/phosphatase family protein [Chitinophagaceae bacterium]|nr:endonuclease/exonuclease/phosphatase family protein [Chitinophagaceae bacterium]